MLVLVTGVTGNLGLHLIDSLSSRGHKVRGLGRSPDKLTEEQSSKLDSFSRSRIIGIYSSFALLSELALLAFLLRAVIETGDSFSFACNQSYDAGIAFYQQAKLTSSIKPIWLLTKSLTEVYFSVPGHGNFSPAYNGPWDPDNKTVDIWGTGHEKWDFSTEKDAAEFSTAVIERDDAPEGGFWELHSGDYSPRGLAKIYKEVRDVEITFKERGSLDDLRKLAYSMREQKPYNDYYGFIDLFYQLFQLDGTYSLKNLDNDKFNVKTTSMKEFLRQNPGI
ncbi:hypothetical protein LZL87_002997 [Fusarium oxysporum]|nr:hypothetical protein LZL87_002997 [Fusarium oxysporum]